MNRSASGQETLTILVASGLNYKIIAQKMLSGIYTLVWLTSNWLIRQSVQDCIWFETLLGFFKNFNAENRSLDSQWTGCPVDFMVRHLHLGLLTALHLIK